MVLGEKEETLYGKGYIEDILWQVKRILTEEMEHAAALSVPLTVDTHCGKNWLEAKG